MRRLFLFLLFIGIATGVNAQTTFATADTMSVGVLKTGTVNGTTAQHYYKTGLPANIGAFRLITSTSNTGSAFGIVQYRVFWKNQNTINYYNVSRNPSTSGADTFNVGPLQADSLYILVDNVWAGQTQNYTVKYEMISPAVNNETSASNDTRTTAEFLPGSTTRNGHVGFSSPAGSDGEDYYKIVFPKNGTLKVYANATSMIASGSASLPRIYFYDRNGGPMNAFRNNISGGFSWTHIGSSPVAAFATVSDTFSVYGRAADTMYLDVLDYVGSWSATYSLRWEVADTALNNEAGPNETQAQANPLAEGQLINGDISYVGNGPDVDDYYRIVLAKDATITLYASAQNTWNQQANPAPVFYVQDKNGTQLLVQNNAGAQSGQLRVANASAVPFMATVTDTMHVFGRAKDTFYVRVQNYHSGQGFAYAAHYTLRYQLDETAAKNEQGPNDTRATAQAITPADTVRGNVSYLDGWSNTDVDDYYRIVKPAGGTILLYITGKNTWGYVAGYAGAPVVRVVDKNNNPYLIKSATSATGGSMRVRNNGSLAYRQSVTDTMVINCVSGDTVYVHISNYINFQYGGVSSQYQFRYEHVPGPKADMVYTRLGNEFGFVNKGKYADAYLWLMGNGQQYTSFYPPMTTYGPGNYDVKLIGIATTCNQRDTAKVNITIAGIEYYTPKKAGRGGDVAMQIFGGALDATTAVKLVRGTTIITPREKYTNGRLNHLTADFDLHFADTGFYDVVIQVPGQAAITYTNGFHVAPFKYPLTWSQVSGPTRMRTNVDNRYTLLVGNPGNVTANGVVVAIAWPKSVQLTWKANFYKPDYTKNDTLAANGKTYIYPNTIFDYIYDSVNTTVAIDSFENKPFDGYLRFIQVQHIPPGETVEIPFIARSASSVVNRFVTYTHRPNMLGSCATGNYEDFGNDLATELLDGADMIADKSKIPLLVALTKTSKIGQHHMQSAATYVGKEFWAWYDGYETDHDANVADWIRETEANNEYAMQVAAAEIAGLLLNNAVAKAKTANEQIKFGNRILGKNSTLSPAAYERTQAIVDRLGKSVTGINYDRLKLLTDILQATRNLKDFDDKIKKLDQLIIDCPELQDQVDELKKLLNQELDHQDPSITDVDTRTSFDPNGIYGPGGVDIARYIADIKRQPFIIHFENADTAGADAQDVIVRDTIDKSKFDVSSITLGDVVIANQLFRVPKGRMEFILQKSVAAHPGMFVRISGKTDTAAGVITWTFTSIDSASMNRPLFDGFLKPNVARPEGEASVSYEVNPMPNLTDGATMHSSAHITFDDNKPIVTDVWSNTLDLAPPSSQVVSATHIHDSTIMLRLTGADASSGVAKYYVYFSTNGGPWKFAAASDVDSMLLLGQPDSSYRFYSTAVDKVQNPETKAPVAEASLKMPSLGVSIAGAAGNSFSIYPNPATQHVVVSITLARAHDVRLLLRDLTGRLVASPFEGFVSGSVTQTIDVSRIPGGVYMVQLQTEAGISNAVKLTVVH